MPLNPKQRKAVRDLWHLVFGSSFPLSFCAQDYGRIAQKVEGQARVLESLNRAAATVCSDFSGYVPASLSSDASSSADLSEFELLGELPGKDVVAALPVVADRVKLPAAPAFSPQSFMDSPTANVYDRVLDFARAPTPKSTGLPA